MGFFCQLGTKVREIMPEQYTNSEPHSDQPNISWSPILKSFQENSDFLLNPNNTTTAKTVYYHKIMNQIQLTEETNKKWLKIHLMNRPLRTTFNNYERQTSYFIANNAYKWGSWKRSHWSFLNRTPILRCKYCRHPEDTVEHVLTKCTVTRYIFYHIDMYVKSITNLKVDITKSIILNNDCENTMILKATNLAKFFIVQHKEKLDIENSYNNDNELFIQSTVTKIIQCLKTWVINFIEKFDVENTKCLLEIKQSFINNLHTLPT